MRAKYILILIVAVFLATGCGPPIRNLGSGGQDIICFGDSITGGGNVGKEYAYPRLLESLIGRRVINAGVGGDTTASALKRLKSDISSRDPLLVIIELGGNDFLRGIPRFITIGNLKKIIRHAQEEGAAVVLCDISFKYSGLSGVRLQGYKKDFKRLARQTRSILVPGLLEGVLDNPKLRQDDIHPNKEGLAIIAERIYNKLCKYFNF